MTVHPRISINQACLLDAPTEAFLDCAHSIGASSVVLIGEKVTADGGAAIVKPLLQDRSLRVECIYHRFGVFPDLDRDDGRAGRALMTMIATAHDLGARAIYMTTGGRGRLSWEAAADRFTELVRPGARRAAELGVSLMIETAGAQFVDRHIAHNLKDTVTLVEQASIGICLELYHIWAEGQLDAWIRRAMPRCKLVQVSDYVIGDPLVHGRAVPGDGVIPLRALLSLILDTGYEGPFDLELLGPRITSEGNRAALARATDTLGAMLDRCTAWVT
jgi:sugar phosphate isomerase/epimerase